MAKITMEPAEAIACGNEIISEGESFKKEVANIYSIVDDLKESWTGTAAARYTDGIESFKEDYEKFGTLINEFGELLVAIGKDYQSLEENL